MADSNPKLADAFRTNKTYYRMMREHNVKTGETPAIENEMLDFVRSTKPDQVFFDAGAGEGTITVWIAEQLPKNQVIAVDLSPVGIGMGQALAKKRGVKNLSLSVDSLEKLTLKDNSVDRVFSQSVVEHVPNLPAMFSELYRVMRPGSEGIIRVSNAASMHHFSLKHYLFHRNDPIPSDPTGELKEGDYWQHRHNFDAHELPAYTLQKLVEQAGLKVTFLTTFPSHLPTEPGSGLKRLLLRVLVALRWLPILRQLGPTTILKFQKP
ncbi:MAG TPA: class I SAM-dependent methyltransferase [Verrucomicrobiae bacterium]|nr:class I SAM-dependent methyltransferase [Verrucomicrobiae bacterium]